MNEVEFRNWLLKKGTNKKVIADTISRLKRIEHEIDHCDIDEEYRSDHCNFLMSLFLKTGINENMQKYGSANFPVGKYYISTYRYALKKYIKFCEETL